MRKLSASLLIVPAIAALSVFAACNKLSKATYKPPVNDTVIVKSNVLVVDTAQYKLISTDAQLQDGIYVYSFKPSITDIRHNGDFAPNTTIIGVTGQGYLRKVVSISSTAETITVNTVLGKLEDVFQQGKIVFKAIGSGTIKPLDNNYNDILLTQGTGLDVTLKSMRIISRQAWDYTLEFHNGKLTNFSKTCNDCYFYANLLLNIASTKAASIHVVDTLESTTGTAVVMVGNVPVLITTATTLVANVDGNIGGAENLSYSITNTAPFTASATYTEGNWQNSLNTPSASGSLTGTAARATGTNITCNIVPTVKVMVYGKVISSSVFPLNNSFSSNVSTTTTDWDFTSRSLFSPELHEYTALVSNSASELNKTWNLDSAVTVAPYSIIKASGDNQTGIAGQYLASPIVARVVDKSGNGVPGVTVHFKITSGSGSLTYTSIVSDANGLAPASWQFGYSTGTQTVEASAKNGSGNNIVGSPTVFTAH